jgi:hypothetical protein
MILWAWHNRDTRWEAQPLVPGDEISLSADARLWLVQEDLVILFARPGVSLNGTAALSMHAVADQDEITIGTAIWCVSFDSIPERKTIRSAHQPLQCGRCCGPLSDGEAVIVCPQCRATYHDSESLPCWTYGPTCAGCRRSTARSIWQPEPVSDHRKARGKRINP